MSTFRAPCASTGTDAAKLIVKFGLIARTLLRTLCGSSLKTRTACESSSLIRCGPFCSLPPLGVPR